MYFDEGNLHREEQYSKYEGGKKEGKQAPLKRNVKIRIIKIKAYTKEREKLRNCDSKREKKIRKHDITFE